LCNCGGDGHRDIWPSLLTSPMMPVLGVLESGLTTGLETLPKVYPGAFNGQRERGGRPPRGPPGSALLLCSGSALFGNESPWGKQIHGM